MPEGGEKLPEGGQVKEVRFAIDGNPVVVAAGKTILQGADTTGIFIPRYCYHDGLTIAGSCRICQVEVKGRRDPVISCYERAQDGMEVLTASPMVRRVRRAVMEFLLLNHPIDCPICDTSGECDLQNFYMTDGRHRSRLSHHKINRKKATRIGARVVLDQERCILCSRCVRFTSEITKTYELGLFGRGASEYIDIIEGRPLENAYAGCVVDVCPVGALTDDDFRFKCRVWYLQEAKSICPRCANGCNISIHYNVERRWIAGGKRVMRLKPRPNLDVNQYWMCDFGRYGYKYIDADDRLIAPRVREEARDGTWEEVLGRRSGPLGKIRDEGNGEGIVIIPSPWMTNEAIFLLDRLVRERLPRAAVGVLRAGGPGGGDGFLLRDDRSPNRLGLETILLREGNRGTDPVNGHRGQDAGSLLERVTREGCRLLVLFDTSPEGEYPEDLLRAAMVQAGHTIVFGIIRRPHMDAAGTVLPVATHAETEGTYTNYRGRVQRFWTGFRPIGQSLTDWMGVSELGRTCFGLDRRFDRAFEVFDLLAAHHPSFMGMSYSALGDQGAWLRGGPLTPEAPKTLPHGGR